MFSFTEVTVQEPTPSLVVAIREDATRLRPGAPTIWVIVAILGAQNKTSSALQFTSWVGVDKKCRYVRPVVVKFAICSPGSGSGSSISNLSLLFQSYSRL
jgi:hypothetical protein